MNEEIVFIWAFRIIYVLLFIAILMRLKENSIQEKKDWEKIK